jgi:glyoxylase-like metal-dependent hydrolase (beta-lactamase superfamily II)
MFEANKVFPGITHIRDQMGVCMTLIEGKERAVLVDAGYGTEDVAGYVRTLTDKPVSLILTHGHHDHVLGARWFPEAMLCAEDAEEYVLRTGEEQRRRVAGQALSAGITVPEDFLTAAMPKISAPVWMEMIGGFSARRENLGSREILMIKVPGHTAGSLVIYVPEERLLLTGDDWNPCTWMWFPCSLPVTDWLGNMKELLGALEEEGGVEKVLCSHQPMIREGTELKDYLEWVTEGILEGAEESDMSPEIRVRRALKPERGWELAFDWDKYRKEE